MMIVLTQLGTGSKISIKPKMFILQQPRKTLWVGEKPVFHNTALMSVADPNFVEIVKEDYEPIKKQYYDYCGDFIELTHDSTGTRFLFCPDFFMINAPGWRPPGTENTVSRTAITSIWNSAVWVPVAETFDEVLSAWESSRDCSGPDRKPPWGIAK